MWLQVGSIISWYIVSLPKECLSAQPKVARQQNNRLRRRHRRRQHPQSSSNINGRAIDVYRVEGLDSLKSMSGHHLIIVFCNDTQTITLVEPSASTSGTSRPLNAGKLDLSTRKYLSHISDASVKQETTRVAALSQIWKPDRKKYQYQMK